MFTAAVLTIGKTRRQPCSAYPQKRYRRGLTIQKTDIKWNNTLPERRLNSSSEISMNLAQIAQVTEAQTKNRKYCIIPWTREC